MPTIPARFCGLALSSTLLLSACGDGGDGSPDLATPDLAVGQGTARFVFDVTNGARMNAALVDPLKGTIYGDLFLSEDVNLSGPIMGAQGKGAVEVMNVDVTTVRPSAASFTTPSLPEGMYTFLGFFDVDGNGAASKDPDAGDPVTLPFTNKFEIKANQETARTVEFDLIFN